VSGQFDAASVDERVKIVMEMADQTREYMDVEFEGAVPGYIDPDAATFMAWYESMLEQSPPVPMVLPDGRPVVASPWATALGMAKGGPEIVRRYTRLAQKRLESEVM